MFDDVRCLKITENIFVQVVWIFARWCLFFFNEKKQAGSKHLVATRDESFADR